MKLDTRPVDCAQAVELIRDFAEGEIDAPMASALKNHLETCPGCNRDFQARTQLIKALGKAYNRLNISDSFDNRANNRLQSLRDTPGSIDALRTPARLAAEAEGTKMALNPRRSSARMVAQAARIEEELQDDSDFVEGEGEVAAESYSDRLGAAPWWLVSCALHALVILLASLITMSIELPKADESIIMMTELAQRQIPQAQEEDKKKPEQADALSSKRDTPPTDPNSKEASDIVVPPDILAKAELGDHFETINPDLPDTHSALGNPDSHSFHSVEGNTEPEGGGGMNGIGMEDMIGVGGTPSKGTGGGFGGGDGTGTGVGTGAGHGSFGQRNGGGRRLMVKRHGGSKATENAVDKALEWLAYHQEADGHWDSVKYNAEAGKVDTAMTSLALLAFLGAGHSEKVGQYKDNVQRAVQWLIGHQEANGCVFDKSDTAGINFGYSAAMATMALSEAGGMANIKMTRESAQKAVNYCVDIHQNGEGSEKLGWRYSPKADPADISNSGWFVMALKSAKVAGIHVDPAAFEGAIKYIDSLEIKNAGPDTGYGPASRFKYCLPDTIVSRHRDSAIGVLCRQFLGWKKEDLQSSVELYVADGGVPSAAKTDLYYWYYGALSTFQQGGDIWKNWNEAMKTSLLPTQCKNGDDTGSWDPAGEFSKNWGRVGQTALSALCLEVYYRYLQINPGGK